MTQDDYFSSQSESYAKYRPLYPGELFQLIADSCSDRHLAWDCATGNGQAAVGLSVFFEKVMATDISSRQIAQARAASNIDYRLSSAEKSEFRQHSFDVILVAQALHWFDLPAFFKESRRVLKTDGLMVIVSYQLPRITPEINSLIDHLHAEILGSYWPTQRVHVDNGYRDLSLPLDLLPVPEMSMSHQWFEHEFMGYLSSWSAVNSYTQKLHSDPLLSISSRLSQHWGKGRRRVTWPLTIRMGKFK